MGIYSPNCGGKSPVGFAPGAAPTAQFQSVLNLSFILNDLAKIPLGYVALVCFLLYRVAKHAKEAATEVFG